jgi:hypothetical protein
MRYTIVLLLAVAGCSNQYDACLEKEREEYRQRNPKASHSAMSRKQAEFEMMCSSLKGK